MCSLDVAQPSATVRNRPRDCYMAVPRVASFRVAGVTFRRVCNVSKVVLCGRRNTFATFSEDAFCSFRGRRSTLDVSIVILRGRRNTLDASCCVFFANRIGRAALSGDKVQIPWQAWHFVRCAEN